MNQKVLSFGMAAVSALSAVTPALAVEQHSGDGNNVPVELTVEKPTFSVTVPTGLPVAVDASGKVYCSTTATIKNNTFGQVKVSNVTIEGNTPWTVADWALDMQKEKVNTSKIAMQLNKGVTGASGYQFAPENFPVMDGHGSLPLTYDAKLPAQTKVISGDTVANVVFTVGWNTDGAETPTPAPVEKAPVDRKMMAAELLGLTGTITFSDQAAPPSATTPLNSNGSVVAEIVGQDATVYSKDGGGVEAPVDSSSLFSYNYQGYKAKTLDLTGLDTSKVTKMTSMFDSCAATTITGLDSLDTSNVTDMSAMFIYSNAASLDLSGFDTRKVEDMGAMFMQASAASLDVSSFDTSKVTNMYGMFNGSKATTITGLNNFDTSSVTSMISMFEKSKATSLDVSSFNTGKVEQMGKMFAKSSANTITGLNNFNTSNVTFMDYMFDKAKASSLNVSGWNTSKVTNMGFMFQDTVATTITGLNSFDTSNVTDMTSMFMNSAATTLDLSSFDMSNTTNTFYMFYNSKATKVYCRTDQDMTKMKASHECNISGFQVGKPA